MRRRLIITALVAVFAVIAPGAEAFFSTSTTSSTTWACAGVKSAAGVCLDSPLQTAFDLVLR